MSSRGATSASPSSPSPVPSSARRARQTANGRLGARRDRPSALRAHALPHGRAPRDPPHVPPGPRRGPRAPRGRRGRARRLLRVLPRVPAHRAQHEAGAAAHGGNPRMTPRPTSVGPGGRTSDAPAREGGSAMATAAVHRRPGAQRARIRIAPRETPKLRPCLGPGHDSGPGMTPGGPDHLQPGPHTPEQVRSTRTPATTVRTVVLYLLAALAPACALAAFVVGEPPPVTQEGPQ